MDERMSRAVREAFVRLYEEGLIYRGKYIVNWCPRCMTAVSDLEVVHEETQGKLYEIRYPVIGADDEYIVVATTRPETMLGDTAVAVNSARRALPASARQEGPAAADESRDPDHHRRHPRQSRVRHRRGEGHALARSQRLRGRAAQQPAADRGDERSRADERERRPIRGTGPLRGAAARAGRPGTRRVSGRHQGLRCAARQVRPLQDHHRAAALDAVVREDPAAGRPRHRSGRAGARSSSSRRTTRSTYFEWMRNIHDWCISRQLWWGHRIPAWHCKACGEIIVAREAPASCNKCGGAARAGQRRARHLVLVGTAAVAPRSAGRRARPTSTRSIPRRCSSPASTSCSSGWRA